MRQHWTETAERVDSGDWRILGEDERGDLLVPVSPAWWQGKYRWWNPFHWRFWLRSRITGRIYYLESVR